MSIHRLTHTQTDRLFIFLMQQICWLRRARPPHLLNNDMWEPNSATYHDYFFLLCNIRKYIRTYVQSHFFGLLRTTIRVCGWATHATSMAGIWLKVFLCTSWMWFRYYFCKGQRGCDNLIIVYIFKSSHFMLCNSHLDPTPPQTFKFRMT